MSAMPTTSPDPNPAAPAVKAQVPAVPSRPKRIIIFYTLYNKCIMPAAVCQSCTQDINGCPNQMHRPRLACKLPEKPSDPKKVVEGTEYCKNCALPDKRVPGNVTCAHQHELGNNEALPTGQSIRRGEFGGNDAVGAFIPAAKAFAAWHMVEGANNVTLVGVDNGRGDHGDVKPDTILKEFAKYEQKKQLLDGVAFFCHGDLHWIQLGFTTGTVGKLAKAITDHSWAEIVVVLYCCLTGKLDADPKKPSDSGFAYALRNALLGDGSFIYLPDVWAHAIAAHATDNPYLKHFGCIANEAGEVVVPYSKSPDSMWAKWEPRFNVYNFADRLRYAFPFMALADIRDEAQNPGTYKDYRGRTVYTKWTPKK